MITMDEQRLLYLAPGALRADSPEAVQARWRTAAGSTCGSLSEALAAMRGDIHLVLSAGDVLVTRVSLSRRQGRHIQKVLPYLLEESVLGRAEDLWFAHGRPSEDRYPVLACERQGLEQLLDWCAEASHARIIGAWVDADLLRDDAPCMAALDGGDLLCLPDAGQALVLPQGEAAQLPALLGLDDSLFERIDEPGALFARLAERFAAVDRVNLLHSDLRPVREGQDGPAWLMPWVPVARLAAAVLVCIWVLLMVQTWQYEKAAQQTAEASVTLYQELFPGTGRPQMIVREFETQLNRLGGGAGGSGFLALMGPTGEIIGAASGQGVTPRRLNYDERESILMLDLNAQDFSALEALREALQSAGLSAEIGTARSEASGVTARMRVGQG
ncbi:type II secretion system protein GspL [Isoalcanivorax indicus]|uniref:type II secretion system protein GspL n=1 Tax=Isoalcanivorax indicus TaxID=2202653 RepID=UPI000DB9A5F0|nr:type II secretion system protein GspL [Isoalcanivorax indicus]